MDSFTKWDADSTLNEYFSAQYLYAEKYILPFSYLWCKTKTQRHLQKSRLNGLHSDWFIGLGWLVFFSSKKKYSDIQVNTIKYVITHVCNSWRSRDADLQSLTSVCLQQYEWKLLYFCDLDQIKEGTDLKKDGANVGKRGKSGSTFRTTSTDSLYRLRVI